MTESGKLCPSALSNLFFEKAGDKDIPDNALLRINDFDSNTRWYKKNS